jgi:alkylation response protein AidB-like acyl-CoA dehydrogenase
VIKRAGVPENLGAGAGCVTPPTSKNADRDPLCGWVGVSSIDRTGAKQQSVPSRRSHRGPSITIGMRLVIPTLSHGTPEQVARFADATRRGEITWCQLFSEPAAGSDLAALRTKATPVDGGWSVSGHKVWNSWAHHAEWSILIARTDPSVGRHAGLTFFFVINMATPGLEIRPIRPVSGRTECNEVFLVDVHLPDHNRIGPDGGGGGSR